MKKIVILGLLLMGIIASGQNGLYDEASVSVKPEFPGGDEELLQFVIDNFNSAREYDDKPETLELKFIVEANGSLTDIKPHVMGAITESHYEAMRILGLSPKWKPAKKDGKAVRCKVIKSIANPHAMLTNRLDNGTIEYFAAEPKIEHTDIEISFEADNTPYKYEAVKIKPEFPGGNDKLFSFLRDNYKSPREDLNGKVTVKFIVETDGSLSDFLVSRDMGYGTGNELVRVLKKSPKWIPGEVNGKAVRVLYTLSFTIGSEVKNNPKK